jgi:hypothetical protein
MTKSDKIMIKPLMGVFNTGQWKSIPTTDMVKNGVQVLGYEQLRKYQKEILEVKEQSKLPHFFINCPTGAGKSKAGLALISKFEKNTKNLIIISTPQREIGRNFVSSFGTPQKILDHTWLINPSNQLCENNSNEDGNVERLRNFLSSERISDLNERVLVCCHATLSLFFDKLTKKERNSLFEDVRLLVDESHHSLSQENSGNGLGNVVNHFLKNQKKNLKLIMMTATPFRGDKGSLIPEKYLMDFSRYDLDYGRHFEENCNGLEFTYNAVLHQYGNCCGKVIEKLLSKHLKRNDKVLIQIPPSNMYISNGKFNDLQMIYDSIGKNQKSENGITLIKHGKKWIKVLDLVTEKNRESRLDYLRNNPMDIDVVVGIAVIKEGFDWPPANAGILIGSQGSLNAQLQIMGRMFRDYENKGKNRGKKPVEIHQIYPFIDFTDLDEDQTRDQINTFMKVVYSALAMELIINPVHVNVLKGGEKGEPVKSVKNYLLEHLTDTQYTEFIASVMDDYRDWKAFNENGDFKEKFKEIVSKKLTKFGITEYHGKIVEYFNRSLQRIAKFQTLNMENIDISHININLMIDVEDPIESIIMTMSNGLCGASNIKDFQKIVKTTDTLRKCYELKEWVENRNKMPSTSKSRDVYERKLGYFMNAMKAAKNGSGESYLSEDHIKILEGIPNWSWKDGESKRYEKILDLKDWIITYGRYPSSLSDDDYERSLKCLICNLKRSKKLKPHTITENLIQILESIPNWTWENPKESMDDKIENLYKWCMKNGRIPNKRSTNNEEKKLGFLYTNNKNRKLSENSINRLNVIKNNFT